MANGGDKSDCKEHWIKTNKQQEEIVALQKDMIYLQNAIARIERARFTVIEKILYPIITAGVVLLVQKLKW